MEALLKRARQELTASQIVHVRANYTREFAQNFLSLNAEKPLPVDVHACSWAEAKQGEYVCTKSTFDAFNNTRLQAHLRQLGVTRVVVCGLLTSVCVLFSMHSAFASGFGVTLYAVGTGDRTQERHQAVLDLYEGYIFTVENDLDNIFRKS